MNKGWMLVVGWCAAAAMPAQAQDVAAAEAPIVNVLPDPAYARSLEELKELMAAPRTRTVIRDKDNHIIGSTEEIA